MYPIMVKFLTLVANLALFYNLSAIPLVCSEVSGPPLSPSSNNSVSQKVVINELMVDPTPVVDLPPYEWIELHNTGEETLDLSGWKIAVGNAERTLSGASITAGGYLLLCTAAAAVELSRFGHTLVIQLPALRNSGNLVLLTNAEGQIVDQVNYSDTWYGSSAKRNGGYTLERIDPLRSCDERNNWSASSDPSGGTPGARNSIFANNTDQTPPQILQARAVSGTSVILIFSESIEPSLLTNLTNYAIAGLGNPYGFEERQADGLLLHWNQSMESNKSYWLELQNLADLCGNQLKQQPIELVWNTILPGDIIINEVLFNPLPGGFDYVELYNRSEAPVDLHRLVLAGRDNQLNLRQLISLGSSPTLMAPKQYLAFALQPEVVASQYPWGCAGCIVKLPTMPAYNNDKGWVVLLTEGNDLIDEFAYTEKMHHPLLHNVKGVSLERVDPYADTYAPGNWQSAAADAGFGTPGSRNSQMRRLNQKATVIAEPRAISPNGDGFNDAMDIRYTTPSPGWIANAWIFNLQGRPVQQLLHNQLVGTEGVLIWEANDPNGGRLPIGPYLLMFEMYDLRGEIHRFREAVYVTDSGY